jgi:hypothetical protein
MIPMSDVRISESPNPSRCPVCATGFTATPGATCPACGRVFVSLPSREYDSCRKVERFRLDGPGWIIAGGVSIIAIFYLSQVVPGVSYFLSLSVIPAFIRWARLVHRRAPDASLSVSGTFIAALGACILMGVAAGAAGFATCSAIIALRGITGGIYDLAFVVGGITTLFVFVTLFIMCWPHEVPASSRDPGED